MKHLLAFVLFSFCAIHIQAQTKKPVVKKPVAVAKPLPVSNAKTAGALVSERLVEISTPFGIMVAKLYNETPQHRDNFIKLVSGGFYDSLLFHRIINEFMIQGGDPQSKNATSNTMLGNGSLPGERIPAEFSAKFFHKKGALAAARDNNPTKASSNCQFYIVDGKKATDADLEKVKQNNPSFIYKPQQVEVYKRVGGAPFLDQNYTVFGEVISGLDVIDKISKVPTSANNRPAEDVRMKIRLLN